MTTGKKSGNKPYIIREDGRMIFLTKNDDRLFEEIFQLMIEPDIKDRKTDAIYIHPLIMPGIHSLAAESQFKKNDYITRIFLDWIRKNNPKYYKERLLPLISGDTLHDDDSA
jgi:hypothetical protein